jgi:hypothetical protein
MACMAGRHPVSVALGNSTDLTVLSSTRRVSHGAHDLVY